MKRKSPPAPSRAAPARGARAQVADDESEDGAASAAAPRAAPFFPLDALSAEYLVTDFTDSKQGDSSDLNEAALAHGVTLAQIGKFLKVRGLPKAAFLFQGECRSRAIQTRAPACLVAPQLSKAEREERVARVARFCVLSYCSGSSAVIEEQAVAKVALRGQIADSHPRLVRARRRRWQRACAQAPRARALFSPPPRARMPPLAPPVPARRAVAAAFVAGFGARARAEAARQGRH